MHRSFRRSGVTLGLAALLTVLGLGAVPASAHPDPGCEQEESTALSSTTNEVLQQIGQGQEQECTAEAVETNEETGSSFAEPADHVSEGDSRGGPYEWSTNLTPLGFSRRDVPTSGTGANLYNSDLAFSGNLAFQGTYAGFRVIDITDPSDPVQLVNYTDCASSAGQGDLVVYGDILVRSWDAPASASASCGGQLVGSGFEGIHLFDISSPSSPAFIRGVRMASNTTPAACGSHTATAVPDPARGNLYLYVGGSSSSCTGMDVVRIPLAEPQNAVYLRRAAASRQCHDNNVIMGEVNLAVCAGGNGFSVFSFDPAIDPEASGGIANPTLLYSMPVTGVSIGHSASFSWDGSILIFGHEPGGGSQAQCQATSSATNKTLFFFEPRTGAQLGTYVHPRPQGAQENCTWHNFNVVPSDEGHVFVSGNYQSGILVVDFTNPAAAQLVGHADPARLGTGTSITLGGDWSTYWYDGHIYESDIRRGMVVWKLDDPRVNRARKLGRSNPQTQELSFEWDEQAPQIEIASPLNGATYPAGSEVRADYTCTDEAGGSGLDSCEGSVADGDAIDTSTPGEHTFTVEASDAAGNTASASVTYTVVWPFDGFYQPIEAEPAVNAAQAGSSVPVKFSLGGDRGLDILEAGYPASRLAPCGVGLPDDQLHPTQTAGGSTLHYADGQYVYVWKTSAEWAGTCRQLVLRLRDGSEHTASFRFR